MSESKARERREAPKTHQLSVVSVTSISNLQMSFYSIHEAHEVEAEFVRAFANNLPVRIETGDKSDITRDSIVFIPSGQILVFAVAQVSRITL